MRIKLPAVKFEPRDGDEAADNNLSGIPFLFFSRASQTNKCQLELVETAEQYRTLMRLRRSIFMRREGYPLTALTNGFERVSAHILAKVEGEYVGMISVKLDDVHGLPIEKHIDLGPYRNYKLAEFDKLGVIDDEKHRGVFYQLVGAAYALVRFCGHNSIIIFTLKKKAENIKIYKKMGFTIVDEFTIFDDVKAVAMLLDLDRTVGVMWRPSQLAKLAKRLLLAVNK